VTFAVADVLKSALPEIALPARLSGVSGNFVSMQNTPGTV